MELSIGGTEWVIIAFAALILILGTDKLPEAARRLGKASAEYKRARYQVEEQISGRGPSGPAVRGPAKDELQKLSAIASSMGIDPEGKDEGQLRREIAERSAPEG